MAQRKGASSSIRWAYGPLTGDFLNEIDVKTANQCKKRSSCASCENQHECFAWKRYVHDKGTFKKYSHFDHRTSLASTSTLRKVLNPLFVSKYAFWPFVHYQIPRVRFSKSTKELEKKTPRDIRYCAHLDRCIYQRYSFLLDRKYNTLAKEKGIDDVAIAYRTNLKKCNIDFAKDVFHLIRDMKNSYVLVGDFKSFFDNLDHNYLKKMICKLLGTESLPDDYYAIFKSITRYSSWDWKSLLDLNGLKDTKKARKRLNSQETLLTREDFRLHVKEFVRKNNEGVGIPQGSPISAVLSNIYMIDFDYKLNELARKTGGFYRRYCDDFVFAVPINCGDKEFVFNNIIHSALDFIEQFAGVTLQKDKTTLMLFSDSNTQEKRFVECDLHTGKATYVACAMDYLGFLFDHNGIHIRPKSITKYHYRLQKKCRGYAKCKEANSKVSPKNIYKIYAYHLNGRTFPNYVERANKKMNLNDSEAYSVLKNSKAKIRKAIKRAFR